MVEVLWEAGGFSFLLSVQPMLLSETALLLGGLDLREGHSSQEYFLCSLQLLSPGNDRCALQHPDASLNRERLGEPHCSAECTRDATPTDLVGGR